LGLRPRLVVRFAIDGDLRFLSHRDTMRMFERALARAGWPVRFTEGFNPRPRLSLPLPRSVGTASDDEWLIVELAQAVEPEEALRGLARQMPAGIRLLGVAAPAAEAPPQPVRVRYEVALKEPPPGLDEAIEAFLARDAWPVTRASQENRPARSVDIRPFVEALVRRGDCLEMVLRVTPQGAARPSEVLDSLGLSGRELAHRLRRTRVYWSEPTPPRQSAGLKERTSWKTQTNPVDPVDPADPVDQADPDPGAAGVNDERSPHNRPGPRNPSEKANS
jgi:radical SAM-linked protein